jgi:hypothetical protein
MADSVSRPRGIALTVPGRFVLARLAAACAVRPNNSPLSAAVVTPDYLAEPARLS